MNQMGGLEGKPSFARGGWGVDGLGEGERAWAGERKEEGEKEDAGEGRRKRRDGEGSKRGRGGTNGP